MRFATLALMILAVALLARIAFAQIAAAPSDALIQTAISRTVQAGAQTIVALPASRRATEQTVFDTINSGLTK